MRKVLRTDDAAAYVGLAAATLEKMRLRGDGPAFVRLGCRAVGYDVSDLDRWIAERKGRNTSERSTGKEDTDRIIRERTVSSHD